MDLTANKCTSSLLEVKNQIFAAFFSFFDVLFQKISVVHVDIRTRTYLQTSRYVLYLACLGLQLHEDSALNPPTLLPQVTCLFGDVGIDSDDLDQPIQLEEGGDEVGY